MLGIPGELRNRIYRLTLITSDDHHRIKIVSPNHDQPALLKTCRQIRSEALKIFEAENGFAISVINLRPITPQGAHWAHRVNYKFTLVHGNQLIFSNLKAWIKAYLDGKVLGLVGGQYPGGRMGQEANILFRAFALAGDLWSGSHQVSWRMVEGALETWKETVAIMDSAFWADESDVMQ